MDVVIQALPLPHVSLRQEVEEHLNWAKNAEWRPLFGGRSNCAWQVTGEDPDQAAILKLYRFPAQNPLFPNDPQAEARLLTHLAKTGIAPSIIASFETALGFCNLYKAVPGTPWTTNVQQVAELISKLHRTIAPNRLRQAPNGSEALLEQADKILAECSEGSMLQQHRPKQHVPPSKQTVLLHCDIVPGNLIQNDSGLHLIDWQCPAVGDATEDLAMFLSPAMQLLYRGSPLTKAEEKTFLSFQSADQKERYHELVPFYHYRMAAYCLWQSERDRPDYAQGFEVEFAALKAC